MIVFKIIVSSGIHLNKNSQSFGGDTGKLCKCLLLHIVYGNNLHFAPQGKRCFKKSKTNSITREIILFYIQTMHVLDVSKYGIKTICVTLKIKR